MTYKKIPHENVLLEHYHFKNQQFSCKVFPHLGGSIQELSIDNVELIRGISIDKAGIKQYKSTYPASILFPFPNRTDNGTYVFKNTTHQLPINEPALQNAIHGLVYNEPFQVDHVHKNGISLTYQSESIPGFPFQFLLNVRYGFSTTGISIKFEVRNVGGEEFPFGLGWHPYFVLDDYKNTSIHFSADKKYLINQRHIPKDSEPYNEKMIALENASLDTAFRLSDSTILVKTPNHELKMFVPNESFLQLYTPEDRNYFAIEPMTCIANSLNSKIGLRQLAPNESWSWDIDLTLTRK